MSDTSKNNSIKASENNESVNMGVLENFLGLYLRAAYESVYLDFITHVGEDRLKPKYFTILTLVVNNPTISQTMIGQAANLDKSTVAKALRWLEDNDYITRTRPDHDRRTHLTVATSKGKDLQHRMQEKGQQHLKHLQVIIGDERYATLIETLKYAVQHLPKPER